MGKKFIKGLTSVLIFCFIVVSGSSLSASATTKNKISNNNEPEITTLYADDYLVRYLVSENDYQKYSFTSYGDSWTHYFWYAQPINL